MIVYHGSNMVVDHPDVNHSYRDLDFGRGFYVTTVKEQAEKWAKRKAGFSKESGRAIPVQTLDISGMTQQFNGLEITAELLPLYLRILPMISMLG